MKSKVANKIKKYLKIITIEPHQSKSRRTFGETINFELKLKYAKRNPVKLLKKMFQSLLERLVNSEIHFRGIFRAF
jgi:hypothetical protein